MILLARQNFRYFPSFAFRSKPLVSRKNEEGLGKPKPQSR